VPRIRLENVSLVYTVYDATDRSLKKVVYDFPVGGLISTDRKGNASVTALQNISLDIREGDRVAILGHNGAGKSTLLRVLSGVYVPQKGEVTVEGKISTLFSIDLGIDQFATGYENIILRGLILGHSRAEVERHIDEISDFSELGSFLHMPVRTYSTGMRLRLAFAIATSIQPEILLMDEWIGAGDSQFIEKAEKRLHHLIESSSILVLATHDINHASHFCNKALLMKQGEIIDFDSIDSIVKLHSNL